MINSPSSRWSWHVRGYYNDSVKYPKQPNALAIEIGGVTLEALSMDIDALKKREDIRLITIIDPNSSETILE